MAVPLAVSMVERAMLHGHFGLLSVNEAPVLHRPLNRRTILAIAITNRYPFTDSRTDRHK